MGLLSQGDLGDLQAAGASRAARVAELGRLNDFLKRVLVYTYASYVGQAAQFPEAARQVGLEPERLPAWQPRGKTESHHILYQIPGHPLLGVLPNGQVCGLEKKQEGAGTFYRMGYALAAPPPLELPPVLVAESQLGAGIKIPPDLLLLDRNPAGRWIPLAFPIRVVRGVGWDAPDTRHIDDIWRPYSEAEIQENTRQSLVETLKQKLRSKTVF
ncbi:MAG: hypothetical protein LBJ44_10220 [Propionibacteriaceae bacterium]|jgi:hypothetical protein|nr:hypothetical protein [Propionibacteriaceae bacterium]